MKPCPHAGDKLPGFGVRRGLHYGHRELLRGRMQRGSHDEAGCCHCERRKSHQGKDGHILQISQNISYDDKDHIKIIWHDHHDPHPFTHIGWTGDPVLARQSLREKRRAFDGLVHFSSFSKITCTWSQWCFLSQHGGVLSIWFTVTRMLGSKIFFSDLGHFELSLQRWWTGKTGQAIFLE